MCVHVNVNIIGCQEIKLTMPKVTTNFIEGKLYFNRLSKSVFVKREKYLHLLYQPNDKFSYYNYRVKLS